MPIQVKEVIMNAARLVGRDDLATKADLAETGGEVALLLKCFASVESEIALVGFPLSASQRLVPQGNSIALSAFSKPPLEVLSVTSTSGMGIPFTLLQNKIELERADGAVNVTYTFAPAEKGLEDVSELPDKVTARTLALGVASEFMLAHGLYAEAERFDVRFREALRRAKRTLRKLSVPARRWV